MKRKAPKTLRGWSAKYRRAEKRWALLYDRLVGQLQGAKNVIDVFRAREERRKQHEMENWSDYDRAVDQTTTAETELFMASPAYRKYQEFRRARDARPQFKLAGEPTVRREGNFTIVETKEIGVQGFNPLSGRTPP